MKWRVRRTDVFYVRHSPPFVTPRNRPDLLFTPMGEPRELEEGEIFSSGDET
jgi:hypothetical protein